MDKTIVMPLFMTGEVPEQTLPSDKLAELTELTATLIRHAATHSKHGPNRPRTPQEMKLIAKMFKQTVDTWYAEEVEE